VKTRMRIFLASLLAVVLLGGLLVGAVGMGQVAAQTQPANQPSASFVTRLAAKLGVEQAKLEAAIIQVHRQQAEQALNERMQKAVASGKMTQEQADKYKSWWLSRPDFGKMARLNGLRGLNDESITRIAAILGIDVANLKTAVTQVLREIQDEAVAQRLQQAVTQGKMTQEQANTYKSWWLSRPETAIRGFIGSMGHGLGRFMHWKRGP
jgi:polyhydroxyalkanoate synthesis regulator phasin